MTDPEQKEWAGRPAWVAECESETISTAPAGGAILTGSVHCVGIIRVSIPLKAKQQALLPGSNQMHTTPADISQTTPCELWEL